MRPFRFLAEPGTPADGRELAEIARRAEAIGYDVLVYPDHLIHPFAVVPLLATAAAATERLRVAAFVLNNDLRHPAVLAQDLATLDRLSGGRVEVAIGAGWYKAEYDAIGLPFDPVQVRQARLAEAIAVLKGCFGDGPFSFEGEHYRIRDHDGQPKPVQRPHPPIFIGGGGRRTLELAAREAQTVGLAPRTVFRDGAPVGEPRSYTLAATEEKIAWVREAAGDRFAELEFNVYPSGSAPVITDDARGEAERIAQRMRDRSGTEITTDEVLESPHIMVGSVDALVDKFRILRERFGISSIMTGDVDTLAPVVERLAGT
ncbi:MAG TPA: TIGR03621 family F420-dependent LLM class oxidoreductase [Candidatus Limnocylindrales bacterium]|nr:TIGR03621 family F420-dependent LLM class oxidoreductase [Candidatus Limnocylindrales bacterium]